MIDYTVFIVSVNVLFLSNSQPVGSYEERKNGCLS